MERDDSALIEACLAGDAQAWSDFVDRYGRLVYSIPRKLGLPASDADDVFQMVFQIVARRLETLRDNARVAAWLIRATYRETWRHVRAAKKTPAIPDNLPLEAEPSEDAVYEEERRELVRQAMSKLDPRCQELIRALFFETETPDYQQLAARLGMQVGSIGPTRQRCFQKLEALLSGHDL